MHARLIDIPLLSDPLGTLGVVEGPSLLPFAVRRFYFIRDVPAAATRGSHAHKVLRQVLIALNGSLVVDLDDGKSVESFELNSAAVGLHIPPGYWRTLRNFSPETVVAVLASEEYAESDYIRNYQDFLAWSDRG
ncbi:MAG TPA: FdtA/QdtA family cupin domain-containing protein [Pseudolysinimonas sp.]|nr:FdtA/QdtA family cupin domain-containing protein [Pseudolysinimonas sp.]